MDESAKKPPMPFRPGRRDVKGASSTAGGSPKLPESVRRVRNALADGTYSTDELVDAALDRLLSGISK